MKNNYTIEERNQRRSIRENFLHISDEFEKYLDKENILWLYSIKYIPLDKIVYIGKTTDIIRRATQYVAEYFRGDCTRDIDRALKEKDIINFTMNVEKIAFSEEDGIDKELSLIKYYNTVEEGYNMAYNSRPANISDTNAINKRSRSKLVCILSKTEKKLIVCTGLKLAGELLGRTKDMMKTYARHGIILDSYFIYYLNYSDFHIVLEKVRAKEARGDRLSHLNYDVSLYGEYIKYAKYIKKYLKTEGKYNPENFLCLYVTQTDDNETGYAYNDIHEFLEYYKNDAFKIYN